ncbi:MAG: hypothetical protein RDV48_15130 [Candidatus Eremiobacteraeota bacterium]|nr:hypothetical protein [Candidatus Eremiobacteraeota bacterium]
MKRTIIPVLIMAVLALALLIACPAFGANTMAGKWKASSGYTVYIPDGSGSFTLLFESFKGEKITHPAQWVTVGREFTWTDKQGSKHTATLDPSNPNRIEDINSGNPGSPAYWYRI